MIKKQIVYITVFLLLVIRLPLMADSQFDDIDKEPIGAHRGQMLLGAFVTIGYPMGSILDAESDFLSGTTYTFEDGSVTKLLQVNHLAYSLGIMYEYMPINHLGIRSRVRRSVVVQRSNFGADYENWSGNVYSDFSFLAGPTYHLTRRKSWDVIVGAYFGYGYATYSATPVAAQLIDGYSGSMDRKSHGFVFALETSLALYTRGGLFISLGFEYGLHYFSMESPYDLTQPNGNTFYPGEDTGVIHTLNVVISAGYAFDH